MNDRKVKTVTDCSSPNSDECRSYICMSLEYCSAQQKINDGLQTFPDLRIGSFDAEDAESGERN